MSIQLARAPASPSPAGDVSAALSQEPTPTPFTDPPVITNRGELFEALEAEYPAELRAAGVEGTALVYFFVNETGALESATIELTSGYEELDEAALRIAERIRFRPALDEDMRVSAWVQVPITFEEEPSPCTRCGGIPGPQSLVPLRGASSHNRSADRSTTR